jgi:exportin-T
VDLAVTLTPETLAFYHRILKQSIPSLRIAGASILKTLVGKGLKDQAERLQVLRILDVVNVLDPLEASTRDTKDDDDNIAFRASLGGVLQVYGSDLITITEEVSRLRSFFQQPWLMSDGKLR